MNNIQQKQIQIVDLKPQYIQALNKNKYQIRGNDGITYECWDQNWYSQRRVGEWLNVQFEIKQKQAGNGKLYTNYIIYTPRAQNATQVNQMYSGQPQASNQGNQGNQSHQAVQEILGRINLMEENIIEAIRMHCGNNIKIEQDDVPDTNTQIPSNPSLPEIPVIDETPGGYPAYQGNSNPF